MSIAMTEKTDQALVADLRMQGEELSNVRKELVRRGVESTMFTYQDGRVELRNFECVIREAL